MLRFITTLALACALVPAPHAAGQDIAPGRVVDAVACAGDPSQTYALYLPSTYTPSRPWPLILGFHPGARGRAIVDTYQAAAERYGYIVAASNNSRNGSWDVTARAVSAMTADIARRFPVAAGRFYTAGLSGGARVALQIALTSGKINGVIASSAGFPDATPRSSVPFVIYGTAGTEDFNYIEMKLMGRALKTPHRIVIFEGGHQLPPAPVAMDAVEWLEVQAMRANARERDPALINALFDKRVADANTAGSPDEAAEALQAVVADFDGLHDVANVAARVKASLADPAVKRALKRAHDDEVTEARMLQEIANLEGGLGNENLRAQSLLHLRDTLTRTFKRATAPEDSRDRRQARRVLRAVIGGASERVQDSEYRALVDSLRLPGAGRGRGTAE